MALNLSKAYTPAAGNVANSSSYNTDIAALFNAFAGLEAQTSSLGALTITPSVNGDIFIVNNTAGTELISVNTTDSFVAIMALGKLYFDGGSNTYIAETSADVLSFYAGGATPANVTAASFNVILDFKLTATKKLYLDGGGNTYILESAADTIDFYANATKALTVKATELSIPATGHLALDGGGDTYILESSANVIDFYVGSALRLKLHTDYEIVYNNLLPNGTTLNLGSATDYWNDVNYKTLTDRGCLGWFDEGVELQDGRKVSDTQALLEIKKHPTKKTIYGVDMMDYKTFPKCAYKKATKKENNGEELLIERDSNDEPIGAQDGIEMTSMFSIMIGAIKELTNRVKTLEEGK